MSGLNTTTYLILIFCAILLFYGGATALWVWRRRHDPVVDDPTTILSGIRREAVVIRQIEGSPTRFDYLGFELRQAIVQTVDEERPRLFEVELVDDGRPWPADKAAKLDDDDKADGDSWLSKQPMASLLDLEPGHPRLHATYLVAMPSPPAPPLPLPSFNAHAFDRHNPPGDDDAPAADPDDLELATLTFELDATATDALRPIGTPLFRPQTRTQWIRTGRRRDQGIYIF